MTIAIITIIYNCHCRYYIRRENNAKGNEVGTININEHAFIYDAYASIISYVWQVFHGVWLDN